MELIIDRSFQVHAATQLHGDRGSHGGEPPARARLGKILFGIEKGYKRDFLVLPHNFYRKAVYSQTGSGFTQSLEEKSVL